MLPAPIELLESEELPAHVPAMDAGVIPDGPVGELLPQAAVNAASAIAANTFVITSTFVARNPPRNVSHSVSTSQSNT